MPTTPSIDTATLSQLDAESGDLREMEPFDEEESSLFAGDSEATSREELVDDPVVQSDKNLAEAPREVQEELAEDQSNTAQLPHTDASTDADSTTSETPAAIDVVREKEPKKRQPPPIDDLDELLGITSKESEGTHAPSGKNSSTNEPATKARDGKTATAKSGQRIQQEKIVVDVRIQGLLAARVAIYWTLGVCYFVGFLFISQVLTYPEIPFTRHLGHFLGDAIHWGPILVLLTPLVIFDLMRTSQRLVLPVIQVREQLKNMLEGKEVGEVTTQEGGCIGELVTAFEQLRQSGASEFLASAARRREADVLLESMDGSFSKTKFEDALIA